MSGTFVLDSEGLTKAVRRDRDVGEWLALARTRRARVVTSAATLVAVTHPDIDPAALEWTLARLVVEPVSERLARDAAALLGRVGLDGPRHTIDAVVCATALASEHPVAVLTSDPDALRALAGEAITAVKI